MEDDGHNVCSSSIGERTDHLEDSGKPATKATFEKHKISVPFLLNWTNPRNGITDKFEHAPESVIDIDSSDTAREGMFLGDETADATINFNFPINTSMYSEGLDLEGLISDMFLPLQEWHFMPNLGSAVCVASDKEQFEVDLQRDLATEFSIHVAAVPVRSRRGDPEDNTTMNLTLGLELLSRPNIQRFLRLYFRHFNHHSPVVHHGTFNVNTASLSLVFAMMLAGALFSTSDDDLVLASGLLDTAEMLAFSDRPFEKLLAGVTPQGGRRLTHCATVAASSVLRGSAATT